MSQSTCTCTRCKNTTDDYYTLYEPEHHVLCADCFDELESPFHYHIIPHQLTFKSFIPTSIKSFLAIAILLFSFAPQPAHAGWIFLAPEVFTSPMAAGGSVLVRTYTDTPAGIVTNYINPLLSDLDGSGIYIGADGVPRQLSSITPYPPLAPEMGSGGVVPFPSIDWLTLGAVTGSVMFLWASAFGIGMTANVLRNGA